MTAAFLGVESSFSGKRWQAREVDERVAEAMAQRHALPDFLARALAARGVTLDEAPAFLAPRLREAMPDPSRFQDMDKAAARLVRALQAGERVAVFGDYDVDGATSSALLLRFGRAVGAGELTLEIPDRTRDGYGPNAPAMRRLAEAGVQLLICVDCGTTAHEPLAAARAAGLDVIVLDHHAAEPSLPPCVALVNPNRLDDSMAAQFGTLAAVGVTYLFVVAVNRALRAAGWYNAERSEPDLRQWLDLVALGTVCDVVALTGLNRAFVAQGLKILAAGGNTGLKALALAAGVGDRFDTYTAGFILGPRVNAGGRVGAADLGARLLATDDAALAVGLAEKMNQNNDDRRAIEAEVLAQAESGLAAQDQAAPLLLAVGEGWHPGVIGIVASRLKEKYHRPAIVIALEGEVGKGSGRSLGPVDLGALVLAARQAGLLINGGGHKMAAGLTVARDKIPALQEFLCARVARQMEAEPWVPALTLDGLVSGPALTLDLLEKLEALAPFGTGNAEPRFALPDCRIIRASIVGEKHVSLIAMQAGARIKAIAFRAMEGPLGPALLAHVGQSCHLAGTLRRDEWQGRVGIQLFLSDSGVAPGP